MSDEKEELISDETGLTYFSVHCSNCGNKVKVVKIGEDHPWSVGDTMHGFCSNCKQWFDHMVDKKEYI